MSKSMNLEKLNKALFQPLAEMEAAELFGGMLGFTYLGQTERKDGVIDNDYTED